MILSAVWTFTACDDDNPNLLDIPATYSFSRDGASTVSYTGQTDRLAHLTAIKNLMKTADGGAQIEAQDLLDM